MTQIAIINRAPGLADPLVAFWAEAVNQQTFEIANAYGLPRIPVTFYGSSEGLPSDCRILSIKSSIDAPGALGFHDDENGAIFAEVKYVGDATSSVISHECGEEMVDPTCDRWMPRDDDHEQAYEVADRCEGDSYLQPATVLGETRQIAVSNYLLPSAFNPAGAPPFDRMGKLTYWNDMTAGGYVIVRDITTGKVGDVYARRAGPRVISGAAALGAVTEKLGVRGSRLLRRLRG